MRNCLEGASIDAGRAAIGVRRPSEGLRAGAYLVDAYRAIKVFDDSGKSAATASVTDGERDEAGNAAVGHARALKCTDGVPIACQVERAVIGNIGTPRHG